MILHPAVSMGYDTLLGCVKRCLSTYARPEISLRNTHPATD